MRFFTKQGRVLLLAALLLAAVCIWGCGGDGNPGDNSGNNSGSSGAAMPGPSVNYGGQTYRTVIIGGKAWMAENLNHKTGNSWCYDDDSSNCDKYGRLYDWETAVTVCPSGWHLPYFSEWETLVDYAGGPSVAGTKLKSDTGWWYGKHNMGGTDDFGFSALPGGMRSCGYPKEEMTDCELGYLGGWWSVYLWPGSSGHYDERNYNGVLVVLAYDNRVGGLRGYGYSVRCIGD
jgi:uncharacterized protein (TIGR02145 family)